MGFRTEQQRQQGRLILDGIFIAYVTLFLLNYFHTPEESRASLAEAVVITLFWTTALLGGVWLGQNWARYMTILLISAAMLFALPYFLAMESMKMGSPFSVSLLVLFNLTVLLTLIYSQSIRSLVTK